MINLLLIEYESIALPKETNISTNNFPHQLMLSIERR
jgi:hypothetical protein